MQEGRHYAGTLLSAGEPSNTFTGYGLSAFGLTATKLNPGRIQNNEARNTLECGRA